MYHLFFVNDNYYYFFRLHQLLCERLLKMFQQSLRLIEQDNQSQRNRTTSVASTLRLSNRGLCFSISPLVPILSSSSKYSNR